MKTQLLSWSALAVCALLVAGAPRLHAQDDPDRSPPAAEEESPDDAEGSAGEEEPDEPQRELSPEERKRLFEEWQKREKEIVERMMEVFKPLEATWVGEEKLEFTDESLEPKHWKDEWTGHYTFGGRYFEMDGQTEGDNESSYRWICTWDADLGRYRAWYFGDTGANEYSGTLSQDGTHVVWRTRSSESTSEFTMKAAGNRVECEGTDKLRDGTLWSRQTSRYVRKRIDL